MRCIQALQNAAQEVAIEIVGIPFDGYHVLSDRRGRALCEIGPFSDHDMARDVAACLRGTVREAFKSAISDYLRQTAPSPAID